MELHDAIATVERLLAKNKNAINDLFQALRDAGARITDYTTKMSFARVQCSSTAGGIILVNAWLTKARQILRFQQTLDCYLSGQMSERQWDQHLDDHDFKKWADKELQKRTQRKAGA